MKKIISIITIAAASQCLNAATPIYLDDTKPIEQRVEDALSRMTLREKINIIHAQSKFSSPGVPRLGIPELWCTDGPMGVRPEVLWDEWEQAQWTNDSCTAFPSLTALAATWNPDMALLYGKSIGTVHPSTAAILSIWAKILIWHLVWQCHMSKVSRAMVLQSV